MLKVIFLNMVPIFGEGDRQPGVNSAGVTPTAESLIKGAHKAQNAPAIILGEGNRRPGVNSEGVTPTAESLIKGARKAQLPKVNGS